MRRGFARCWGRIRDRVRFAAPLLVMTRARTTQWLTLAVALAAGLGLGACDGQVAIGGTGSDSGVPGADTGSPGTVDGSTRRPDGSSQGPDGSAQQPDGATQGPDATPPGNPLSGTYKGYIESFMFPDGSDTIAMTLTFGASGAVTGTVFFGDAPVLAPPTDPERGLSAGGNSKRTRHLPPGRPSTSTVLQGTYMAPRLQLQVDPQELWQKWCQIQTTIYPQYNSPGGGGDSGPEPAPEGGPTGCGPLVGYGCLPAVGYSEGPMGCTWSSCQQPGSTPVDCGKLQLCNFGGPCSCTATGCTVQVGPTGGVSFDMQLVAGALDGSTEGFLEFQGVLNVHLTKQ